MSTELLSPADVQFLEKSRKVNSRPTVPNIPSIKLKNSEKKVEGLTRGYYFTETYENEEKKTRDIGPNPVVSILHRCYTYSYYDDDKDMLIAWTSEIEGFDSLDPTVYLYSKKGDKAVVEYRGPYPVVKKYMKENYSIQKGDKQKSLMKFQNCLYVLFEGKVYRMFVSNAGAAGIAEGAKGPDFKDIQPKSLTDFIDSTRGAEMAALYEFNCKLGSRFIDDAEQPYHIMTFENIGPNEKIAETVPICRQLEKERAMMLQWDLDRMGGTSVSIPVEEDVFGEDIVATLPV